MKFKSFTASSMIALDGLVNTWLLTGDFYSFSNSFNMVPDGSGGEDYCIMIFYLEK